MVHDHQFIPQLPLGYVCTPPSLFVTLPMLVSASLSPCTQLCSVFLLTFPTMLAARSPSDFLYWLYFLSSLYLVSNLLLFIIYLSHYHFSFFPHLSTRLTCRITVSGCQPSSLFTCNLLVVFQPLTFFLTSHTFSKRFHRPTLSSHLSYCVSVLGHLSNFVPFH